MARGDRLFGFSFAQLRSSFAKIKNGVATGKTLDEMLRSEKMSLDSGISDQVFETLLIAKEFGGKDSNNALRLLSEFIRDDIDAVEEIRTKFGWIRNSAALASAAPWILLVLLSSQQSTVEAFAKPSGMAILILGVVMTVIAFLWMDRVGQLPAQPRPLR
jgi:tight adherence protein B